MLGLIVTWKLQLENPGFLLSVVAAISDGFLFNQGGIHSYHRNLSSGHPLNKARIWSCLTREPVSCSVGSMLLRRLSGRTWGWELPSGGEHLLTLCAALYACMQRFTT